MWGISERGPIKVIVETDAVMFIHASTPPALTSGCRRASVNLRTLAGEAVDALYFKQRRSLLEARDRLREARQLTFESDVKPSDRFVMERFITGAFEVSAPDAPARRGAVQTLRGARVRGLDQTPSEVVPTVCSLDIETDGPDGALLSFALCGPGDVELVVLVGQGTGSSGIHFVPNEQALLREFVDRMAKLDPDILIGWNIVDFDLTVLERRCGEHRIPFSIGRNGESARVLAGEPGQVAIARIPGRVVLDGIATLKNATWSFERFTLEHVSQELLGRGKRIELAAGEDSIASIRRMARDDPAALAAYNLEDARLVAEIFQRADLVGFARERAQLVGLPLDRKGGSVAAFDHLYLPRLHRAGYVGPDVEVMSSIEASPGGEVLASVPGLHDNVLSFDFRSLYPSIIRTFKIDPLGLHLGLSCEASDGTELIAGFEGARFTRSPAILPALVEKLTLARTEARDRGNEALSRAIKILMNSLYGVLGSPGCRFFDARLASSITRRGHEIIEHARDFFEAKGMRVLYGDTDSVFVDANGRASDGTYSGLGEDLARELNTTLAEELSNRLGVESALELRLDSHYESFLMPTVRGSEVGSKKRYAGAVRKADGKLELVIRGLEAVRTDWTPLARNTQRELLARIFNQVDWQGWLRGLREDLFRGRLNQELVYRRRVRRDLDSYAVAPPHVKAARIEDDDAMSERSRGFVEYVMTTRGPLPARSVVEGPGPGIDHRHYLEKQLAPACDVILSVLGTSFDRVAGTQLRLF